MNSHPRYLVLFLAVLSFWNFAVVKSAVGRWGSCHGYPASDAFKAPNGEIPAYTKRYHRFGTCPSSKRCFATFSYRGDYRYAGEPGHGDIVILRKYDQSQTGDQYKWVNYGKFLSKLETCEPVSYEKKYNAQVCYLPGARVKKSGGGWELKNLLGNCWTNRKAYYTYNRRQYSLPPSWAYRNAEVLCMAQTKRIEVTLTHVDTITSSNLLTSPDIYIHDSTENTGHTPIKFTFIRKYSEKHSSSYSTEHGWKLEVSTKISGGLITDAVARFETTITAGAHGTYITGGNVEKTSEITYQREFEVPGGYEYTIDCIIYKQRIRVGYRAMEKHFDKNNKLLHQIEVSGTWTGVTTVQGKTKVTTKKIAA